MAKLTKKAKTLATAIDRDKLHGVDEAIALARANATSKFDETIEVALNLGVDPRHADQMVRGVVNLPNGTGRTVRVAVFAKGANAGKLTKAQIKSIAEAKMKDLNAADIEGAMAMIEGSARAMGLEVVG